MKPITRKTFLKTGAAALVAGVLPQLDVPFSALAAEPEAQPLPTQKESAAITEIVAKTMEKYGAPAISLAVARHGQFVFRQGFGLANKSAGQSATSSSRFRIASVTKPITSVAIFTLIEQGRLGLHDLIFGEKGRLGFDYGDHYPDLVGKITLYHLLTHTGGGWQNDGNDPMFRNPKMNHRELITWALQKHPLENEPGTHYAYSNFGYCILGRVIEKITGQSYANYVEQSVLKKCGIADMEIGGNTLTQRASEEVIYYSQDKNDLGAYEMNVSRMDSHGGWIATPSDLVRFAMHVDGFKTTPNILRTDTLKTMLTGSTANSGYASGWCINNIPNWWHNGSLPGTLSIMVRTHSGLCWAALTNTRAEGLNLDEMMWQVAKCVPAWHA
jgi:CubicO group peptidase (beta-lactamase class C family)